MPRKLPPTAFDFKAARKARKVSQEQAAQILHATQPSISRWEADGTMPEVYKMAWLLFWQLEDSKDVTIKRRREASRKGKDKKTRARRTDTYGEKSRSSNRIRVDDSEAGIAAGVAGTTDIE